MHYITFIATFIFWAVMICHLFKYIQISSTGKKLLFFRSLKSYWKEEPAHKWIFLTYTLIFLIVPYFLPMAYESVEAAAGGAGGLYMAYMLIYLLGNQK